MKWELDWVLELESTFSFLIIIITIIITISALQPACFSLTLTGESKFCTELQVCESRWSLLLVSWLQLSFSGVKCTWLNSRIVSWLCPNRNCFILKCLILCSVQTEVLWQVLPACPPNQQYHMSSHSCGSILLAEVVLSICIVCISSLCLWPNLPLLDSVHNQCKLRSASKALAEVPEWTLRNENTNL